MDEPFGAVDPIVRGRLQRELLDLQAKAPRTIVLVTHDIDEAVALGDQVAILNVGGVLEQLAAPDELLATPANDFVASFLGSRAEHQAAGARHGGQPADRRRALGRRGRGHRRGPRRAGGDGQRVVGPGRRRTVHGVGAPRGRARGPVAGGPHPRGPPPRARAESSLREALEVILTQRTPTAVVEDADGGFRGLVQLETIRQGLAG